MQEFRPPQSKEISRRHSNDSELIPPKVDLKGHTIEELAIAANVSVKTIEQAIAEKQRILDQEFYAKQTADILSKQNVASDLYYEIPFEAPSTTTRRPIPSTTKKPSKKYHMFSSRANKVVIFKIYYVHCTA